MTLSANMIAFLTMLSHSEGTDRRKDALGAPVDPYRCCFQGELSPGVAKPMHIIQSLNDHPAITGEWRGESLAFLGPKYVGLVSTAAGRYQINKPTWLDCRRSISLPDFTGPNQDAAAVFLITRAGAADLVNAGNLAGSIPLLHNLWASLPGGTSGQPQNSLVALTVAFTDAGGVPA